MKKILLKCTILIVVLCSCQSRQQVTAPISTIDSTLQTNATAILESKLSEINAQSGQVVVMEVQTGQIKALVGLTRKDSTNYQSCENFSVWQSTGLQYKKDWQLVPILPFIRQWRRLLVIILKPFLIYLLI